MINGPARELDLFPMLTKRLTHIGSTLRSRTYDEKAQIIRELEAAVWPLIKQGSIKPQLYRMFDLRDARAAHALMDSGRHIGKIVLRTPAATSDGR